MPQTCSLDVADNGTLGLDGVAYLLNVTTERARQIETAALESFRDALVFTKDDI
jgi:DNA-directed RNA polymerase sigma subunit (sigma70/sigma32)